MSTDTVKTTIITTEWQQQNTGQALLLALDNLYKQPSERRNYSNHNLFLQHFDRAKKTLTESQVIVNGEIAENQEPDYQFILMPEEGMLTSEDLYQLRSESLSIFVSLQPIEKVDLEFKKILKEFVYIDSNHCVIFPETLTPEL